MGIWVLDEARAGIQTAGRNINSLRYADDTTLWQKVLTSVAIPYVHLRES